MSINRIASRYAKSLLDLAIEQGSLEDVQSEMSGLSTALENRDLYLLMKSPIVNASKKRSVVDAIFGDKLGQTTLSFLRIIIRKGRESILPEITASFLEQYRALKSISTATVVTAEKLDPATLNSIKDKLLKSNITEENVELKTEIDPSIIGGYIIKIGDKLYDASVVHKLNKLRKELIS